MKSFILMILILGSALYSSATESITIKKGNSSDPSYVCDGTSYNYTATITGKESGYTYSVIWTVENGDKSNETANGLTIKWKASTQPASGNIGTIKATLMKILDNKDAGSVESNTLTITIKSIKHIEPEILPYNGSPIDLNPCDTGILNLYANQIRVPGTGGGTFPDEPVYDYLWQIPSGWTMNGYTSDGSTWLPGTTNVSLNYPASTTGGKIVVKGYHAVSGCSGAAQQSLPSKTITVTRDVKLSIQADKSYFLCGSTDPITFTVSPALSCAVYYWNGSTTASDSPNYQMTPGTTNAVATVEIRYADKNIFLNKSVKVLLYPPDVTPYIIGPQTVCTNSTATYTISDLRPGYSVRWQCTNNLRIVSSDTSCTIEALSSGAASISATIVTDCGERPLTAFDIWIGAPDVSGLEVHRYMLIPECLNPKPQYPSDNIFVVVNKTGPIMPIQIENSFGAQVYNVQSSIPTTTATTPMFYITKDPSNNQNFVYIKLRTSNECGWSDIWKTVYIPICSSRYYLTASPNPISTETTIELKNEDEYEDTPQEWQLNIFDQSQTMKANFSHISTKSQKVNTQNWKDGIYFIKANVNGDVVTKKIIIKK